MISTLLSLLFDLLHSLRDYHGLFKNGVRPLGIQNYDNIEQNLNQPENLSSYIKVIHEHLSL